MPSALHLSSNILARPFSGKKSPASRELDLNQLASKDRIGNRIDSLFGSILNWIPCVKTDSHLLLIHFFHKPPRQ
jgi:hypothetical protein